VHMVFLNVKGREGKGLRVKIERGVRGRGRSWTFDFLLANPRHRQTSGNLSQDVFIARNVDQEFSLLHGIVVVVFFPVLSTSSRIGHGLLLIDDPDRCPSAGCVKLCQQLAHM
jgi:hypothetical protein